MKRRPLLAGAAAASLAAGIGWGWKQRQDPPPASDPATSADPAVAAFWKLSFEAPSGPAIHIEAMRGKPLLINFWGTWCPPCIQELPLLDAFARQQQANGWQVVGIAVDGPTPVREFLAKKPVSFPIGLAGMTGLDLARSLGNANGVLPFTAVFNPQGRLVERHFGAVNEAHLAQWVKNQTKT